MLRFFVGQLWMATAWGQPLDEPPATVLTPPTEIQTPAEVLVWLPGELGLATDQTFVLQTRHPELGPGLTIEVYDHVVDGDRVEGEGVSLLVRDGRVERVRSRVTPGWAPMTPSTDEAEALEQARRAVSDRLGISDGELAETPPQPCIELLRGQQTGWICRVEPTNGPGWTVVVPDEGEAEIRPDAVPQQWDDAGPNNFVVVTGETVWHGPQAMFYAQHNVPTGLYRLHEVGIQVRSALPLQSDPTADPVELISTGLPMTELNTTPTPWGTDVMWGLQHGLAAWWSVTGTEVQAAHPGPYLAYVDAPNVLSAPAWTDFKQGALFFKTPPMTQVAQTTLAIVSHELAHMVSWDWKLVPTYTNGQDDAAISEGFAGISSDMVEEITGYPAWTPTQEFTNPSLSGKPDVYMQTAYLGTTFGDDHGRGFVLQHWGYNVSQGNAGTNSVGTTFAIEGVGTKTMMQILWGGLALLSPSSPTYPDLALSSRYFAETVCGTYSQEATSTYEAWHVAGLVGNSPPPPTTFPAHLEMDVSPWDASLSWEIGAEDGTAWEVQITTGTFDETTPTHTTSTTTVQDGVAVGTLEGLTLEPDTTYTWRVRRADPFDEMGCWRPPVTFATNSAEAVPFAPGGADVQPWKAEFSWSGVQGATHYIVEVREALSGKAIFPPQWVEANPSEPDVGARITVLVDKAQEWRVQPVHMSDNEVILGAIGTWTEFVTSMPTTTLTSPADLSTLYPWPIAFDWADTPNARAYLIDTKSKGHWGYAYPETSSFRGYPGVSGLEPGQGIAWFVKPKGPVLGWEGNPEPLEDYEWGEPTAPWTVLPKAKDTVTTLTVTPPGSCLQYGTEVTVSWTPVPGATRYYVSGDIGPFVTEQLSVVTEAIPADSHDGDFEVWVVAETNFDGTPHSSKSHGWAPAEQSWPVRPTMPKLLAVYPDAYDDNEWDFDFTALHGFDDYWVIETYEGGGCEGDLLDFDELYLAPDQEGGDQYGGMKWGVPDGQAFSMRLRAARNPACDISPWSNCHDYGFSENTDDEVKDDPKPSCQSLCDNACPSTGCPQTCDQICLQLCLCSLFNGGSAANGVLVDIPPFCCGHVGMNPYGVGDCECPLGAP